MYSALAWYCVSAEFLIFDTFFEKSFNIDVKKWLYNLDNSKKGYTFATLSENESEYGGCSSAG